MLKIISYILTLFILVLSSPAWAESADAGMEARLFELINSARVNPLAAAASLGMNTEQVLADLPELHDVLINGLPPLVFNANLQNSARSHVQDMLNRDYYNRVSPEGVTPEIRIAQSGYVGDAAGESLGLLGFVNFVSPDDAVNRIFENMFKDELNPGRIEKRNILSPELKDIGVGIGAGLLSIGSASAASHRNAYVAACYFGTRIETIIETIDVQEVENILLQIINYARGNPLKMLADMGFDTQQVIREFPHLKRILVKGLQPISFEPALYDSARIKSRAVFESYFTGSYFDINSDDLYYRIMKCGYSPVVQAEIYDISEYDNTDPQMIAWQIFERLFKSEFNHDNKHYILNPDFEDIGISLSAGFFQKNGLFVNAGAVVLDFTKDAVSFEEKLLLELINQARMKPLAFAETLGLNTEEILANLPEYHDVLINGLPPLVFNPYLRLAAEKHAYDMVENNYYGHVSPDGRSYEDRILENGYDSAVLSGESLAIECFRQEEGVFPQDALLSMFKELFIEELMPGTQKNILSRDFYDTGIRFVTAMPSTLGGICGNSVYMIVINFGLCF
ncbi:CAP domain-containing protein [Desulfonema limicola]|nr:CAP domain-containing protein [Desulfonema limicola]